MASLACKDIAWLRKTPYHLERAGGGSSTAMCNVPNPLFSYSKMHVIVAHLANYKWANCVSGCVIPITGESRDRGCSLQAGLGPEERNRDSRQKQLSRRALCLTEMAVRRRTVCLGLIFIMTSWHCSGLPCSTKSRVWGNVLRLLNIWGKFFSES